jgi:hypothetical protein
LYKYTAVPPWAEFVCRLTTFADRLAETGHPVAQPVRRIGETGKETAMYHGQFEEYKPVSEVRTACMLGAVMNGMLFMTAILRGHLTTSLWVVAGILNAAILVLTLWKMRGYRGGLSGFWQIYLDRNVIGYDVVFMLNNDWFAQRLESREDSRRDPSLNTSSHTLYVKLGGWGFEHRMRLMECQSDGALAERTYWNVVPLSDTSVILRSPSGRDSLSMSIEFMLRVMNVTDGDMGSSALRSLYAQRERAVSVIEETIHLLKKTTRFTHSKEGREIREWLEGMVTTFR